MTNKEIKLSEGLYHPTSICTTELYAIDLALETASKENIKNCTLYTDSLAACYILLAAQQEMHIDELISKILHNCERTQCHIQWIPSHVGIPGNEIADRLARMGITIQTIQNILRLSDVITLFTNRARTEANTWYSQTCLTKGKKFAKYQKSIPKKMWHHNLKLPPKEIKIINRLIAGHDYGNYWLHKMKLVDHETCSICNKDDTGSHRVFDCQKYEIERNRQEKLNEENFIKAWKTKNIKILKIVTEFIKDNMLLRM